jgi:hypothetical protein
MLIFGASDTTAPSGPSRLFLGRDRKTGEHRPGRMEPARAGSDRPATRGEQIRLPGTRTRQCVIPHQDADRGENFWVEKACARAIEVGDPSYRTVKGILAAGTEADPPPEPTGDGGAAAHLHGPSQLFGNVVALPTPNPTPAGEHATTSVGHDTGAHDGRGDRNTPPAPTEPGRSGSGRGTDSEEAS